MFNSHLCMIVNAGIMEVFQKAYISLVLCMHNSGNSSITNTS